MWPSWRRDLGGLVACLVLALLGLRGGRVPLLSMADLGIHELGHLVGYFFDSFLPWSEVVTAALGSAFQVGVPLVLALSFVHHRRDRIAVAVCLAWASTAAADVARYVVDAPVEKLELIGGKHDWAYILGPEGLDRMDDAAMFGNVIDGFALVLMVFAVAACTWPMLRWAFSGDGRRRARAPHRRHELHLPHPHLPHLQHESHPRRGERDEREPVRFRV
jgi:hypothetical protein